MNIADYSEPFIMLQRKDFKNESVYEAIRSFMNEKGNDTKDRIIIPIDKMRTNARPSVDIVRDKQKTGEYAICVRH